MRADLMTTDPTVTALQCPGPGQTGRPARRPRGARAVHYRRRFSALVRCFAPGFKPARGVL